MPETFPADVFSPAPISEGSGSPLSRITWGLFLFLVLGSMLVAFGAPVGVSFFAFVVLSVLVAWRFPYFSFYVALATAPLIGATVSISTGQLQLGQLATGGAIDVSVGELVAGAVLAAWALRVLMLWRGRRDRNWKPWLPLIIPFLLLVGAHLLSALSPAEPDPTLVIKYSLRPVFFVYLTSVVLPANFIRSRRRLLASLAVLACVGVFFALDGLRSLFFFEPGAFLPSARPLPILGVSPIGENHNVLAELMLFTAPVALALGALSRSLQTKTSAYTAAAFMGVIGLLTFARSAWIALGIEILFLFMTVWRPWIRKHFLTLLIVALFFVPVAAYMSVFSSSEGVKSSTDTRAMLAGIALTLFQDSPWVGVGAGTFVDHVAQTYVFTYEFGAAMDSHGVLQKLAAETGIVGLLAFAFVLLTLAGIMYRTAKRVRSHPDEVFAYAFLVSAVIGAFTYQLFNTTYWTPKLWLPVGILFAAGRVFLSRQAERDPDFLSPSHG